MLVAGEVVQHNDLTAMKRRHQDVLDIDDAREWAKEILATTKDPKVTAKIKNLLFDETRVKIISRGKARVTAHEGTEYTLFIKRVGYSISDAGITGTIDLE